MKKSIGIRFLFLVVIVVLIASAGVVSRASASATPLLSCRLERSQLSVGEKTELIIEVSSIVDFYGYQLEIRFPSERVALLDTDDATSGANFRLGELISPDFVVRNEVDRTGKAQLALTQMNPSPAVSGSGWLARIKVEAVKAGSVPFAFNNVILSNAQAEVIAIDLQGCMLDVLAAGSPTQAHTATPLPTYPVPTFTPSAPSATLPPADTLAPMPSPSATERAVLAATDTAAPLPDSTTEALSSDATAVANVPPAGLSSSDAQIEPAAIEPESVRSSITTAVSYMFVGVVLLVGGLAAFLWSRHRRNHSA